MHHHEVLALVALGGGEHDGVQRAAQPMVEPVEFEARRTAAREAVAAKHLFLHALKDPGVMIVARRRRLAVVITDEGALAREADAAQKLGRPVGAAPQSTIGAVEGVVVLAGLGRPGADAAFGAPDLDGTRDLIRQSDTPVEAVAAEIHQPPAGLGVALQRIERTLGVVLRMRAGQHDLV